MFADTPQGYPCACCDRGASQCVICSQPAEVADHDEWKSIVCRNCGITYLITKTACGMPCVDPAGLLSWILGQREVTILTSCEMERSWRQASTAVSLNGGAPGFESPYSECQLEWSRSGHDPSN
jgi:hypothetical protein